MNKEVKIFIIDKDDASVSIIENYLEDIQYDFELKRLSDISNAIISDENLNIFIIDVSENTDLFVEQIDNFEKTHKNCKFILMSYEFKTTPVPVTAIDNAKATSHLEIDSTKVTKAQLDAIEAILYGTEATVTYSEVSAIASDNPVTEGWYEKVNNVYVLSQDTTADLTKTYYEKVETGAVDARLPLPDEVYTIISSAN